MKTQVSRHPYVDDPLCQGTCVHCGLADPERRNVRHQLPDLRAQTEEHRRRAGEGGDE